MRDSRNYPLIFLICLVFGGWVFTFPDLYFISKLGLILFAFITMIFLDGLGKRIPIKELIGLIMLMQMIVCPVLVYNYFDNEVHYSMYVDEKIYVDFVLTGILLYLIGIFIPISRKKISIPQLISNIEDSPVTNSKIGIALVVIGFLSHFLQLFAPATLGFFFYLLESLKYVGVFYILFSNNRLKYVWLIGVFGYLTYEIIGTGIFINLFIWVLLLFIFLSFRYRLRLLTKLMLFIAGIFVAFFIQTFKGEYREVILEDTVKSRSLREDDRNRQQKFVDMATEKAENTEGLYEYGNLNNFVSRLNQGWILARVLTHVPFYEEFTDGQTLKTDIYAALVPRILDPDKTSSGGKAGEIKFGRFTGKQIRGTAMSIGTFGDAYINFGVLGGVFFMFVFGLFLNLGLTWMYNMANTYPALILWIPFIFFTAMRAGNDFVVILNFITKSSLVVYLIFFILKKYQRDRVPGKS